MAQLDRTIFELSSSRDVDRQSKIVGIFKRGTGSVVGDAGSGIIAIQRQQVLQPNWMREGEDP